MKNFFQSKKQDTPSEQVAHIPVANLVQMSKIFSEPSLIISQCQNYLVSLIQAIIDGETFSEADTQKIFFSITQSYNNKDLLLHRFLLLALKFLKVDENSAIMVTQSLTKDIGSDVQFFRAWALRLMPYILSKDVIKSQERTIKPLIVSQNHYVALCGLSLALKLCLDGNHDVVEKWVTEIHNASNTNSFIQNFALLILYFLRKGDGNLLKKMADQSRERPTHSALSAHVLVQVCSEALRLTRSESAEMYLTSRLQAASQITQLDAARAILANERSSPDSINLAIKKLNNLLTSSNNVAVFGALRTINDYACFHRDEFSECNTVLERLLSENNSDISALAAIALLHTGFETTIDRSLPIISQFATKLSSEQQASLIQSCTEVVRRHPNKLEYILNFMWGAFRSINDFSVQNMLITGFFKFAETIQSSRLLVFRYLCEYVEDSKFSEMTLMIVRFIGENGPEQENRTELVRCLSNRLSLENAEVRAASIDALAKFGYCEDIGPAVIKLIEKRMSDPDDEVRDRATFHVTTFRKKYSEFRNIVEPVVVKEVVEEKPVLIIKETPIDKLGKPLLVTTPVHLTEEDSELVITYKASVFLNTVSIEFIIKNTLDKTICNIDVRLNPSDKEDNDLNDNSSSLTIDEIFTLNSIEPNSEGSLFVTFKRQSPVKDPSEIIENLAFGSYTCEFVFFYEDDDSEEVFPLDNEVKLMMNLYIKPTTVGNFKSAFDSLSQSSTVALRLQLNSYEDAINFFRQSTGLDTLSKSQKKDNKGSPITIVQFAGMVLDKELVLALLEMRPPRGGKMMARITVKSNDETLLMNVMKSFE